ncbi:hypothetical protein GCM10011400_27250 [Paraburkholderia caffeinilytica]|uniref:Uncharacterized protein n=1 Tax=Paraburkholderia caffeinilytica TaxID=1761016 RepID=A0ABQ1MF09_9BURK|nr:hypothetical protein GCM10011400_27250 [Paraburkholderia caffeinilytica]
MASALQWPEGIKELESLLVVSGHLSVAPPVGGLLESTRAAVPYGVSNEVCLEQSRQLLDSDWTVDKAQV